MYHLHVFFLPHTNNRKDNEYPVISDCPTTQNVNAESGMSTGTSTWTAPTASDNSAMVTLETTHSPGDPFDIGTTTVTYTATDSSTNTATCTFDVVVTGNHTMYIILCGS